MPSPAAERAEQGKRPPGDREIGGSRTWELGVAEQLGPQESLEVGEAEEGTLVSIYVF